MELKTNSHIYIFSFLFWPSPYPSLPFLHFIQIEKRLNFINLRYVAELTTADLTTTDVVELFQDLVQIYQIQTQIKETWLNRF